VSRSIRQVVAALGLRDNGGNQRTVKLGIDRLGLDVRHFGRVITGLLGLDEMLVEDRKRNSNDLKRKLIQDGYLQDECFRCGQEPYWNSEPLTLELHHRNGRHTDNRIENLEILCPNCHTQTKNHRGKANRRAVRQADESQQA